MKKACGILMAGLVVFWIATSGEPTLQTNHPFVQLISDVLCPEAAAQFKEVGRKPGVQLPVEQIDEAVLVMREKRIEKGLTLAKLAEIAGVSPVYIASVLNGQHRLDPEAAKKVAEALDLDEKTAGVLTCCKLRNKYPCTIDPFLYRMVEVLGVYGDAMRDQFNEKFGDGIMSAITFSISVDKEVIGKDDFVVITWKGKFLPYLSF